MMEKERETVGKLEVITWVGIFLAGLIFLVIGITHESLWYDESYSAAIINHSIPEIWSIAGSDSHPPLYFIFLKIFTLIFGSGEFGLRFFSVLGVLALAGIGAGPVRRIFGVKTGLVFSFLVMILPINLSMAQETRMYTWAAFFVAASGLYGYIAVSQNQRNDWIRFGVCTVFAAYMHYYALLGVSIINVIIFMAILIKKRNVVKPFLVTALIAVVSYTPWIYFLTQQVSKVSKDFWIQPITLETIRYTLIFPYGNKFFPLVTFAHILAFLFQAIIIWGFIRAGVKRYKEGRMAALGVAVFILTLVAGVVASLIIRPVLVERYIVPVTGIFLVAAAYGISLFNKKPIIIGVCIVIAALSVPQIMEIYTKRFNGPMYEVKAYMQENIKNDDIFVHTDEHTFGTFCYYFPDRKHYLYLEPGFKGYSGYEAFKPNGTSGSDFSQFIKGSGNVWLVTSIYSAGESVFYKLLGSGMLNSTGLTKDFTIAPSWYGVKVEKVNAGEN
ncbi:MAG TPA: glycosyltransferase family 39 protein [Pseudobacteroides sp.]|uniref:glycosyltransferase family 39 protein n=1 Tax=Pseudobacteroides sp. TaxID=1968840 RepID=UPI002F93E6EB